MLRELTEWLNGNRRIHAAFLFGSNAAADLRSTTAREGYDYDIHVIASHPKEFEHVDWRNEVPAAGFQLQCVRPATGGMRKLTAIFAAGQIDLVIVPHAVARIVRVMFSTGLYRRHRAAEIGLNEWATCLHTGYRVLKGEAGWGNFFRRLSAEMPGVRMSNVEGRQTAEVFLIDHLWVLQKAERGELVAAQHALHRLLSEANLRLYRELRQRRRDPVPSFGLGRRVEQLATPSDLARVRLEARLDAAEIRRAADHALQVMIEFMAELDPSWQHPVVPRR